jgi:hypothetical protein
VPAVFALVVFAAAVGVFFEPAVAASVPDLVPERRLGAANSALQSGFQVSGLIGQAAGGVLFRLIGAPVLFALSGVTYLVSAITELFIRVPRLAREPEQAGVWRGFVDDTREGLAYVFGSQGMVGLFIAATLLNFLIIPATVLMPFFVEDTLGAAPDWFGFIMAGFGGGALLGYAGAAACSGPMSPARILAPLIAQCALMSVFALSQTPLHALVVTVVQGVLLGFVNVQMITTLQQRTPAELRGRVFGLLGTLANALTPLAMGLSGLAADALDGDVRTILFACGIGATLCSVGMSLRRPLREFLRFEPEGLGVPS